MADEPLWSALDWRGGNSFGQKCALLLKVSQDPA